MIGDDVELTVLSVHGEKVRLGIQAPSDVPVHRTEIYLEIQRQHPPAEGREDVVADTDESRQAPDSGRRDLSDR